MLICFIHATHSQIYQKLGPGLVNAGVRNANLGVLSAEVEGKPWQLGVSEGSSDLSRGRSNRV